MSRKVVIIIVEGATEEALLYNRLRSLYADHQIRFNIVGGDILYDREGLTSIKPAIGNLIKKEIKKSKYLPSDILAVLQICDLDGCFVKSDSIRIDNNQQQNVNYCENVIKVTNEKIKYEIEKRNRVKSSNIEQLISVKQLVNSKYNYRIYYFSRHLEHVIFNEPNPSSGEKVKNVRAHLQKSDEPIEVVMQEQLPPLNIGFDDDQRYKESWQYIKKDNHSLHRFTNVSLLFDYLSTLA